MRRGISLLIVVGVVAWVLAATAQRVSCAEEDGARLAVLVTDEERPWSAYWRTRWWLVDPTKGSPSLLYQEKVRKWQGARRAIVGRDGARLLVVVEPPWPGGSEGDEWELLEILLPSGEERPILSTSETIVSARYVPQGVAVETSREARSNDPGAGSVLILDLDEGSAGSVFFRREFTGDFVWAFGMWTDGRNVAVVKRPRRRGTGPMRLWLFDPAQAEGKEAPLPDPYRPSGNKTVFRSRPTPAVAINGVRADSPPPDFTTFVYGLGSSPARLPGVYPWSWSPDGTVLLVCGWLGAPDALLRVEGSTLKPGPRLPPAPAGSEIHFSPWCWAPGSSALLLSHTTRTEWGVESDLFLFDLATGEERPVRQPPGELDQVWWAGQR